MAFNLFPQTDFRQMDLNYVLAEVKRAANLTDRVDNLETDVDNLQEDLSGLTGRVDGLSAEIRDPETGLWKAISDIHAANSSQQAQINALIAAQVFARPEDFGGVGDGLADDTAALQAALNSDKPVYLKGTYGISDTIHVNKDKIVLCGESAVIKTLGRVTYALRFGDDPTTGPDAAIPGLIQILWYGGTLTCDVANYFDYGFTIYRCFNSYFYGVTVTNCVGTGFNWAGDYGANAIADNCIVRGPDSGYYGVNGFLVGRNDQRIYNCSAVNMTTGFYADRGYARFEGCYFWLTRARDADLPNVVAYDILGSNCAVIDCTADTVPTGIKLHPTTRNFYAQGLAWYSATSVIADPTGFALFRGSEAGLVCNGFVTGVASSPWPNPVNICTDVSGLTIIGFMNTDMTNIQDPESITQLMPNYRGTDEKFLSGAGGAYEWKEVNSSDEIIKLDFSYTGTTSIFSGYTKDNYTYTGALTENEIYNKISSAIANGKIPIIKVNYIWSTDNTTRIIYLTQCQPYIANNSYNYQFSYSVSTNANSLRLIDYTLNFYSSSFNFYITRRDITL